MGGVKSKQPLRRCIMCRRSSPKEELLRFVPTPTGLVWDVSHRLTGRGAYVHRVLSCWSKMQERNRWEHAFKTRGGIGAENLRALQEETRDLVPELGLGRSISEKENDTRPRNNKSRKVRF